MVTFIEHICLFQRSNHSYSSLVIKCKLHFSSSLASAKNWIGLFWWGSEEKLQLSLKYCQLINVTAPTSSYLLAHRSDIIKLLQHWERILDSTTPISSIAL